MNESRKRIVLLHMKEDVDDILHFIDGFMLESFKANALVKKGVCMSLLNIGELVKELPDDVKIQYPSMPWKSIVGLRNHTAHGYHSLDDAVIWEIARNEIPILKNVITHALNSLP